MVTWGGAGPPGGALCGARAEYLPHFHTRISRGDKWLPEGGDLNRVELGALGT